MKAECTWGDGPDVLLVLDGTPVVLYENPDNFKHWTHGTVCNGSADFTAAEARALAEQLLQAAQQAEDMDKQLEKDTQKWIEQSNTKSI